MACPSSPWSWWREDLNARIRHEGMPVPEALNLAVQMAEALAAAHAAGIVHRDLRAQPWPNGHRTRCRSKILDFGLAKLGEITGAHSDDAIRSIEPRPPGAIPRETAGSMSPEQAEDHQGGPAVGHLQLQARCIEMVSGKRDFQGDSNLSTLAAIVGTTGNPKHHHTRRAAEDCLPLPGQGPRETLSAHRRRQTRSAGARGRPDTTPVAADRGGSSAGGYPRSDIGGLRRHSESFASASSCAAHQQETWASRLRLTSRPMEVRLSLPGTGSTRTTSTSTSN